jgi:HIV Tat-specific factor 1
MTVKFRDPIGAQACVLVHPQRLSRSSSCSRPLPQKMHGRYFSGRQVEATLFNGQQRFKRSGVGDDQGDEVTEEAEKKRLDDFANWLMTEGD